MLEEETNEVYELFKYAMKQYYSVYTRDYKEIVRVTKEASREALSDYDDPKALITTMKISQWII